MSKVNSINELPEWFNIDNYKSINKLNDDELWDEFYAHKDMILETLGTNPKSYLHVPYERNEKFKQICNRQVSLREPINVYPPQINLKENGILAISKDDESKIKELTLLAEEANKRYEEFDLYGDERVVSALSVSDVMEYSEKCNEFYKSEGVSNENSTKYGFALFYRARAIGKLAISLLDLKNKFTPRVRPINKHLFLKMNWQNNTDKELIAEIERLLPEWRDKCGVIEPKQAIIKGRMDDIEKIRVYQVIAFIDLHFWSQCTGNRIKKSVLAAALFPKGEKA